jgi:cytochrome c-type biogenesis protein CcmH
MQDRYGEFVIYKPAYSMENAVLWLGPFVVLLIAVVLARKVGKGGGVNGISNPPATDATTAWAESLYVKMKNKKDE